MRIKRYTLAALAIGAILALLAGAYAAFHGGPAGETVGLDISNKIKVQRADATTEAVVSAAKAFLDTLSKTQRDATVYAFDDNEQRARWSNFPVSFVKRGGIKRGDLNEAQKTALDALLAKVLSAQGLRNAHLQMAADDMLVGGSGPSADFGSAFYYVSFVGEPANDKPWMFQFGGHHLAINTTFAGPQASFSPMLTGGQPLSIKYQGQDVYITREETEAAQAFLDGLDAGQKKAAILGSEPINLLLGPGEYGTTVAPEGVRGADLTDRQKELLLAVVKARIDHFNARDYEAKLSVVREAIDDTYFAWWGPEGTRGAAYYRITAPKLVMEYSPQQLGGDLTEHAHSMYRDPANDYGVTWIRAAK